MWPMRLALFLSPNGQRVGKYTHAGNIASWKKKEGEEVAAGDSIAEIETDKVSRWTDIPLIAYNSAPDCLLNDM